MVAPPLLDDLRDLGLDPSVPSALERFAARGEFSARQVSAGPMQASVPSGGIIVSDGRVELSSFALLSEHGTIEIPPAAVDLAADPESRFSGLLRTGLEEVLV